MEHDLLNEIYAVAHSPLVSGVALESLFRFFVALVLADNQIATHVVPNLVISAEKAPKAESSPSNVAKCIAQVVKAQHSVAAGTIAEYSKYLKVCFACFFLVIQTPYVFHAAKHQSQTIPCYSQPFDCRRTGSFHVCPFSMLTKPFIYVGTF